MNTPTRRAALFFPRRLVWLVLTYLVMTAIIAALARTSASDPVQTLGLDAQRLVTEEMRLRLPVTLQLFAFSTLAGMVLSLPIILLGTLVLGARARSPLVAAVFRRLGQTVVTVGIAVPIFVLGLALLYFFAIRLRWFPVGGLGDLGSKDSFDLIHAVLPVLTLSTLPACVVARSVLGEISHYWNRTLGNRGVLFLHAVLAFLRHGLIQVIGMLGGVLIVESLFSLPGVGRLFIQSVYRRDVPGMASLINLFLILSLLSRALADLVQGIDGFVLLRIEAIEPEMDPQIPRDRPPQAKALGWLWLGLCLLLIIVPFAQGIGGLLAGEDKVLKPSLADVMLPPGAESADGSTHVWGTDLLGRDIHSRVRYAQGRALGSSLLMGLAVLLPAMVGGVLAGYLAKLGTFWADLLGDLWMFPVEVLTCLPGLVLLVFILSITGPGLQNLLISLALVFLLPRCVRMVRDWWIVALPERPLWLRIVGPMLGVLVLGMGLTVATGMALGFLGLGVQPPEPDLGVMSFEAVQHMRVNSNAVVRIGWVILISIYGWFLLADTLFSKLGVHRREAWLELNR